MVLTVKNQKYSFFFLKILLFLIFFIQNDSNAQRIKHLKDAYLYQKFDNEFRLMPIFDKVS